MTSQINPLDHTGLVWKQANSIAHWSHEPVEDLFQEGFIGLMKASERYIPGNAKFSSFAVPYIRGAILQYLRGQFGRRNGIKKAHSNTVNIDLLQHYVFVDKTSLERRQDLEDWDLVRAVWSDCAWEKNSDDHTLIFLSVINGLSIVRIAELIGVGKGRVEYRLKNAVARLRWAYLLSLH